jgi:predicted DNA-binding transcriptional regulator AlpA
MLRGIANARRCVCSFYVQWILADPACLKRIGDHSCSRECVRLWESTVADLNSLPSEIARHRVLDTAESAAFCRISVPHWRRLYRAGKVPKPIRLGMRKYGWRIGDLIDFIEGRARAE